MLRSYSAEAKRLRGGGVDYDTLKIRRDGQKRLVLVKTAEDKAIRMARLLGKAPAGVEELPTADAPTAQTIVHARRRRDPLANMRLTRRQEQAAKEIRDVYESLVRALFVRVRNLERPPERVARPLDPVEFLPERIARLRHDRYLPWVETQRHVVARTRASGNPIALDELSAIGLVISVLIDGEPLGRLEKRFGVRHGMLAAAFRDALDAYADIARRAGT